MLFNSPIFLFLFLPLVLLVYYVCPKKLKNLLLLLASLFFYTWGEKELVLLICASALVDYIAALIIEGGRKKLGLWISIGFNLGLLFTFKYFNFTLNNLTYVFDLLSISTDKLSSVKEVILPLGISFYTFQTMSYTIDVYRGNVKATKNFINFATYVTLFPQLIAGPIIKYKDVAEQLVSRTTNAKQVSSGIRRFILGLAKKMLIANQCAFLSDGIFDIPESELTTPLAWLGVVAYSLQIYYDFSGYSDMAIGLGRMFGFSFLENFNFPFISKSIREFWQRWHISLSNWFKEYVYFSLGGNRLGKNRTYINLLIVFFVTGLWHGASWTFIVWGMLHGFFIILERLKLNTWLKKSKVVGHFYMIFALLITWPFFRCTTISEAWSYLVTMFSFNFNNTPYFYSYYFNIEVILALLFGIVFSTKIAPNLIDRVFPKRNMKFEILSFSAAIALFILSSFYIAIDAYDPFIYFRF